MNEEAQLDKIFDNLREVKLKKEICIKFSKGKFPCDDWKKIFDYEMIKDVHIKFDLTESGEIKPCMHEKKEMSEMMEGSKTMMPSTIPSAMPGTMTPSTTTTLGGLFGGGHGNDQLWEKKYLKYKAKYYELKYN